MQHKKNNTLDNLDFFHTPTFPHPKRPNANFPIPPTSPGDSNFAKALSLERSELVGGFNPSEKYARQIGNLPQKVSWKRGEHKKYSKPPPGELCLSKFIDMICLAFKIMYKNVHII